MKMLYITFVNFGEMSSGSSVRPVKMYEAFKALGVEIKLLEGQQNQRSKRRENVKEILNWLDDNRPDFCYIEPATGPFFNMIDLKLLKKLHKKGIPVSLFYRDAFWKFPKWWKTAIWKVKILVYMHKRDLRYFEECCDVVYFPSQSVARLFAQNKFKKVGLLPPGGSQLKEINKKIEEDTCIYIGGATEEYGLKELIHAFQLINSEEISAKLIVVTPKDGISCLGEQKLDFDWLRVVYTFDTNEIEELYSHANLAVIPFKKQEYMDLTIPIKLYEYIGYGLPIVATNCTEVEREIIKLDCGHICNDSAEDIARCIKDLLNDKEELKRLTENAANAAKVSRWIDRAEKVMADLNMEGKK